jgi:hypothetical protein
MAGRAVRLALLLLVAAGATAPALGATERAAGEEALAAVRTSPAAATGRGLRRAASATTLPSILVLFEGELAPATHRRIRRWFESRDLRVVKTFRRRQAIT